VGRRLALSMRCPPCDVQQNWNPARRGAGDTEFEPSGKWKVCAVKQPKVPNRWGQTGNMKGLSREVYS